MKIIKKFLIVSIVLIAIGVILLACGYKKDKDIIADEVTKITGIENPQLEFVTTESPLFLEYKVTHYKIKGTNLLVSVQHNENEIHFIGVCELDG